MPILMLEDKVRSSILDFSLINQGNTIIAGVSGGADSMCLLHLLWCLSKEIKFSLICVHINHMLRGEQADADQLYVEQFARSLFIPCISKKINVSDYAASKHVSIEEAGRDVRYQVFNQVATEITNERLCSDVVIAVAHHQDDQIETLLMNIIRGTGTDGLTGMLFKQNNIIRPLLNVSRHEIEAYCNKNDITPRLDESNNSMAYTRNRVRNQLIPFIKENFHTDIGKSILKLSEISQQESAFLESYSHQLFTDCILNDCNGEDFIDEVKLSIDRLNRLHKAVCRRVIRKAIQVVKGDLKEIEFKHIDELIAFIQKNHTGKQISLPKGVTAVNSYGTLILKKDWKVLDNFKEERRGSFSELPIPGRVILQEFHLEIMTEVLTIDDYKKKKMGIKYKQNDMTQSFDRDRIKEHIIVRYRRDGDKIKPCGLSGTKKLKDLLMDNKIERDKRGRIPLVVCGNDIIWVVGLRTSDDYKITPATTNVLVMTVNDLTLK